MRDEPHGKKCCSWKGGKITNTEEDEADRFAADRLIEPADWAKFLPYSCTEEVIKEFAAKVGVAPGIVLGRLQKKGRVAWSRLSDLKVRYTWKGAE